MLSSSSSSSSSAPPPLECALRGTALLRHPHFNKGSAFPPSERAAFGLTGMLPQRPQTLAQQCARAHAQYRALPDALARNAFLASLRDQNEVLFFRLLRDNLDEMMGVVYTPTEGDAIVQYSRLFRRPEGCFLSVEHRERIRGDLAAWGRPEDVDYIVVTGE
jgi:malate dehydrogenase (oxaloacetate-decarboxylating)